MNAERLALVEEVWSAMRQIIGAGEGRLDGTRWMLDWLGDGSDPLKRSVLRLMVKHQFPATDIPRLTSARDRLYAELQELAGRSLSGAAKAAKKEEANPVPPGPSDARKRADRGAR